ncbi:MAG: hypothetical protein KIT11_05590 [Fimbriimonadaceae bacterium]|nr:hypothetical protein [Fimbriimonadaceae bacterium]QYK56634.1 MAG: hypothetical protein KF733_03925 [Fimbriimonadaceae bacterium]
MSALKKSFYAGPAFTMAKRTEVDWIVILRRRVIGMVTWTGSHRWVVTEVKDGKPDGKAYPSMRQAGIAVLRLAGPEGGR